MTILVLGAFGDGALENFYVKGFRLLPIEAEKFDITKSYYESIRKTILHKAINKIQPAFFYKTINEQLLRFVQGKKYDVILVFKGLTLFPDTIRQLKKYASLICCYNPDHPFKFFSEGSGNVNIAESLSLYDLHISYAENITRQLKEIYHVDAFTIPFGYDDSPVNHSSFAGAADTILFAGTYDAGRAGILSKLSGYPLTIYGDEKWGTRGHHGKELKNWYAGRSIYGDEYKIAVRESTGVLNLLRQQNIAEQSHNMRTFEVPGYGGVLIADRTEEQSSFFEEDKEAIYYSSIEELKDKLYYLQSNPGDVASIKASALKRAASSGYTYTHRSAEMYEVLKKYLN